MPADEFGAIAGAGLLLAIEVHEGDARLKLRSPRIARQQGGGLRFDFRDDERRRPTALVAQHPVHVVRDRQLPEFTRAVDYFQTANLYRIRQRYELHQVQSNTARGVFEPTVPKTVMDHVGRSRLADGQRRRAPQFAAALVPDI